MPTKTRSNHPPGGVPILDSELRYPGLEFFAGCGLAGEGLKQHFRIDWANDNCPKKGATFVANHPKPVFYPGSIERVKGDTLPPSILAWASFPCQDLSLAGNLLGLKSARSGLVWEWIRVIEEMPTKPPLVVAENVTGLLSSAEGSNYKELHEALSLRGYRVGCLVLDAKEWVPQSRPRVFVVGVDATIMTKGLESDGPIWCHPKSVKQAASLCTDFVWWKLPVPNNRKGSLEEIVSFDAPVSSADDTSNLLSLIPDHHQQILQGYPDKGRFAFPAYRRTRNGKQVLELRFDGLAGCLRTPSGGSSRQFLVLLNDGVLTTRLLTVSEASKLMGVREKYEILGTYNDGYKAMGDAVAVPVVRFLSKHLLSKIARLANTNGS